MTVYDTKSALVELMDGIKSDLPFYHVIDSLEQIAQDRLDYYESACPENTRRIFKCENLLRVFKGLSGKVLSAELGREVPE